LFSTIILYLFKNRMTTYSNYIIVAIVSLVIACIMGMCIVSIIDRKLSDITINIPKPEVTVSVPKCRANNSDVDNSDTDNDIKEEFDSVTDETKINSTPKRIHVNPDWLDKILDTEQYDDVEGYKQYAVSGCADRRKKLKLYPNIVACSQPNYLTAENYYNENFEYPYIPGQNEQRWTPADTRYTNYLANPEKSIRIITKNKSEISKKPPFPSNFWFTV
jgi:hypothetical protein